MSGALGLVAIGIFGAVALFVLAAFIHREAEGFWFWQDPDES